MGRKLCRKLVAIRGHVTWGEEVTWKFVGWDSDLPNELKTTNDKF
jgi:hypothetical protein